MDAKTKKIIWIVAAVLTTVLVIYGVYRIIEIIGSTKNNEVTAEE